MSIKSCFSQNHKNMFAVRHSHWRNIQSFTRKHHFRRASYSPVFILLMLIIISSLLVGLFNSISNLNFV